MTSSLVRPPCHDGIERSRFCFKWLSARRRAGGKDVPAFARSRICGGGMLCLDEDDQDSPPPTAKSPAPQEPTGEGPGAAQGSAIRRPSDSGTRLRPRVLLVDDDRDTREMYAWCLRAAGW